LGDVNVVREAWVGEFAPFEGYANVAIVGERGFAFLRDETNGARSEVEIDDDSQRRREDDG
jgi:hypothetical protein